jgi:hypothetical protein
MIEPRTKFFKKSIISFLKGIDSIDSLDISSGIRELEPEGEYKKFEPDGKFSITIKCHNEK